MFNVGQRVRRKKEWLSHEFWRNNCPSANFNGVFVVKASYVDGVYLEGSHKCFAHECFEPVI